MVALTTVAGIIGAGLWLFRRRKDLFFYFAAGLALMIPYLNLVFMGIWVADRYVYFSSFCVLAIAVTAAGAAWRHSKGAFRLGALAIGATLLANNFLQTVLYEPKWRDAETLWQYHIALPRPDQKACENLAAYYYARFASAFAKKNTPLMVSSIRKMEIVVQAGLAEFWRDRQEPPPPETSYLFFLQSLIQEVKGDPDAALASLLTSDRLHPGFDATNLNLAQLYRKLAGSAKTPRQREAYIRAARDRHAEYIKLAFRGRPAPPEVRREMADIDAEFSAMKQPAVSGPAKKTGKPQ